jgi:hypothetical protein
MPDPGREGSLDFQLKKSTADLQQIERALISGNTDSRVLRDFRDAVDYVRKAAWAVQEWQERQAKSRDTSTVLPLLMFERIRRATQLCKAIGSELEDSTVTNETAGVAELSVAIDDLRGLLAIHPRAH